MKYKAYQVAPEYQESPLWLNDIVDVEGIVIDGNRNYKSYTISEFDEVIDALEMGEFDKAYLPATVDAEQLDILAKHYCDSINPQKIIEKALSIVTGQNWEYQCIRGCCQSEWNYIYYRADLWTDKELEYFEVEYFNAGEEWRIVDENGEECYYYTHEWNDIYKTRELAGAIGCSVAELTLYAFDGWERTPKYKEV